MGTLSTGSKATGAALLVGAGVVAGALIFSGSGHSQPAEQIVIRQAAATSAVTTHAPRTVKPARPAGTPAAAVVSASRVTTAPPAPVSSNVTRKPTAAARVAPQEATVTDQPTVSTDPTTADPQPVDPTPTDSAAPSQPPTPEPSRSIPAYPDAPPPIRPHGTEQPTCDSWNSVDGHATHC